MRVRKPAEEQIHFARSAMPASKAQPLETVLLGFGMFLHRINRRRKHIDRARAQVNRQKTAFVAAPKKLL